MEFLNAFFAEIIKVMSRFIGSFPVISAIIILFGILVMLLGHTLFRTIKYDYDISIFFLVIGIMYFIITLNMNSSLWFLRNCVYYTVHRSHRIHCL